jgi:hypothetical protein
VSPPDGRLEIVGPILWKVDTAMLSFLHGFMADYREPLTDEQVERMERGLQRLLRTPPKPQINLTSPPPRNQEYPAQRDAFTRLRLAPDSLL